jgi:hypothetical protein
VAQFLLKVPGEIYIVKFDFGKKAFFMRYVPCNYERGRQGVQIFGQLTFTSGVVSCQGPDSVAALMGDCGTLRIQGEKD